MSHPHLLGLLFICAWLPQLHTSRNTNEITLSQHIITSNEASKEKFGPNAPPDVHTTPESIATNQAIDHRGTNSSKVSLIIDPTHSHKPKDNEDSKTIYSIAKSLMKSFAVYSISETSTQRINSNSESTPEHTSQSTNQSNDHAITSFYDTSSESTSENTRQSTNQSNDHAITSFYDTSSESTSENTSQSTNQSNDHAITSFYDTSSESKPEHTSQSTNKSNNRAITSFYDTSSESKPEHTSQSTNQRNDHSTTPSYDASSESSSEYTNQPTDQSTEYTSTPSYDTSSKSSSEYTNQPTNQSTEYTSTPSYDTSSQSSSEYTNQPTNQNTEDASTPSYDTGSESSSEYTNQPTNQSTEDASTPSYDTGSESSSEYTNQPTNQSTEDPSTPSYDTSSESSSEYTNQPTNQSTEDASTPSYDTSSESSSEYTNQPTNQSTEYTSTPSYDTSSESSSEYTNQPTNQSTEDASTPSQCAVPDDVTNLNVKDAPEDFSLSISWEPPYNSYCVMNYSVCWNSATEHNCSTVVDTSLVISQLLACTEYTITVTSVGRVGNSLGVSTIQSSKNVVPGPAVNLSLLSRSAHSLTVNWTEPVANPQCVTNYTLCLNNTISCWTNIRQTVLMIQDSVQPCTDYNVTVFALGQAGVSAGSIIFGRTLANTPGKVKAVLLNKTSAVSMDVSWETPEVNSTCITGYRLYWGDNSSAATTNNTLHYRIDDLEACTEYNVSVVAVAEQTGIDTLFSTSVSNETTTDVATPGKVGNLTTREVTATSLNISWLPTTHQACITGYTVCWNSKCTNIRDQHYLIQALLPCTEYSVWVAAVADTSSSDSVDIKNTTSVAVPGPVIDLQATNTTSQTVNMMWTQPRTNWTCVKEYKVCWKDGNTAQTCTITDNTSYTITHLMAATNYSVQVGALNAIGELSTLSDISIFTSTLPLAPHTPVTPVIIAVIVILTAGISATVLYMHCKGILLWPPNKHLDPGVRPPPIPLKTFDGQCRQLLDTPSRLSNEYQLLATLCSDISTTQPSLVGQQIDNRKKNRYVNIIPYDATRVKLDIIGGDYATDYINASFIKGYSGEEEYIATQGPKEETCADFWRMVYQHNVKLIVMVTQFEEQNKVKCHRYFPPLRENLVIGDFVVRCTTELSFPIYTDRTLVIHKNGRKKSVKHLHFQEWPDFGCPENTHFMLQFCSTMRQHIEDDAGLTVVHCSAGVGRTGTLIAIDILLQHIKENKKIDIFNTVYQLRQQRTNMVQTELQYKYIYQCLLEALQDAAFIHPGKLSSPAQSPEPIYENMLGHSPYEKLVKGDTRGKYSFNTNSSIL